MIFYIHVGRVILWGSKLRISIFLGVFRKINILWGMKIFVDILRSSQNWTIFRGHLG